MRCKIMILLTVLVVVALVKEALAAPTLQPDVFTGAEVIFHDIEIEDRHRNLWVVRDIEIIEANDGKALFVATDGFYYYLASYGSEGMWATLMTTERSQYDPIAASQELWEFSKRYNWYISQ
jgi:hypothetical protein